MIDIHCHILPNIDDGSSSVSETFTMIREAYKAGFTDIIATSHYIENEYDVNKEDRENIIKAIQNKLNQDQLDLQLHNGAEAFISNNLARLFHNETIPTLAGSRYVLFELPMQAKIFYLDDILNELVLLNYIPIIAHPERYGIIQNDPNVAVNWVREGVLLQSNYGSILGKYGNKAKQTFIELLEADAIHFLGSDCHRKESDYTKIDISIREIEKIIGKDSTKYLTTYNPEKILNVEDIQIKKPRTIVRVF